MLKAENERNDIVLLRKEFIMFEILTIVLFIWLMAKLIGLMLKLTWGVTKVFAGILMAVAVPLLFVCLLFAGGIALLLPIALIGIAFGIVKACV